MFARVIRWPNLKPEAIRDFQEVTLPRVRQLSGFEGALLLVDRGTGSAITIGFWDTEKDMHASEELANRGRSRDVELGLAKESQLVEPYEVAVRVQTSPNALGIVGKFFS